MKTSNWIMVTALLFFIGFAIGGVIGRDYAIYLRPGAWVIGFALIGLIVGLQIGDTLARRI